MRLPRLIGFASLAVVTVSLACSDATGPDGIRGEFFLKSVNGRGLPAELGPGPGGGTIVFSGSISLYADGTGVLQERTRGGIGGEQFFVRNLTYRREGHRILIDAIDCPGLALCPPLIGVVINSTLWLDRGFSGHSYLYRRADFGTVTVE
jgi:hypothetical protein